MLPVPGIHATHGPLPEFSTGHTSTIKLGAILYTGFDLLDVMRPMRIHGKELNTLIIEIVFVPTHSCLASRLSKSGSPPHYILESAPKLDIFFMPGGLGQTIYTEDPKMVKLTIGPRRYLFLDFHHLHRFWHSCQDRGY
ncbi:hypothetical protein BG005_011513 [Podila minutissima]|nr:hypothetical protein BG005_011513 [Podila minutissima]